MGVEGSIKSICVRRFSPSALSLFRFRLSPFPPETPDTQAIHGKIRFQSRFTIRWELDDKNFLKIDIRAVYTRENRPRLTLAAAYIRRERNDLYEYGLY